MDFSGSEIAPYETGSVAVVVAIRRKIIGIYFYSIAIKAASLPRQPVNSIPQLRTNTRLRPPKWHKR